VFNNLLIVEHQSRRLEVPAVSELAEAICGEVFRTSWTGFPYNGIRVGMKADDIRALRAKLGLSQTMFAERFGLNIASIKDWEQGRSSPDLPARVLLSTIEVAPESVSKAVDRTRGLE
jgi:DNA-binding transcriptional regulator YiaG